MPHSATSLDLGETVAVHSTQIEHLEESWHRIEGKVDRLLWGIICAFAASAGTLLVLLLKK